MITINYYQEGGFLVQIRQKRSQNRLSTGVVAGDSIGNYPKVDSLDPRYKSFNFRRFTAGFLEALSLVILSELGDKTFFVEAFSVCGPF